MIPDSWMIEVPHLADRQLGLDRLDALGLNARSASRIYRAAATKSSLTPTSRSNTWRSERSRPCSALAGFGSSNKRTGIGFAQAETGRGEAAKSAAAIDQADVAIAEAHHMIAGFEFGDANQFADQRLGDEYALAFPHDLARAAHAPDLVIGIVAMLLDAIRHLPLRWRVDLVRRSLAERFMRPLFVVVSAEGVEAPLLLGRIRGRRARGLGLEGAMHALMAAILLRRGWMDEVRLDAELDPPRRQPRQAAGAGRAERRAVVATDRMRQSLAANRRRKDRLRSFDRWRHDPHLDQIATVAVGQRQRVDPAGVAGAEPTFEISRPLVIGGRNRRHRPPPVERPPAPLGRRDQPGPLEDITDRRSRRPAGLRSLMPQHHSQLARSQMREAPAQRNDRFRNGRLSAMRTLQWSPRMIHKPFRRMPLSPFAPLIERVPAYAVATAQIRNTPVAGVVFRQHSDALFHSTGLLKGHRKSSFRATLTCRPSTRSKLSGIYPVCTVESPLTPTLSPQERGEGGAAFTPPPSPRTPA